MELTEALRDEHIRVHNQDQALLQILHNDHSLNDSLDTTNAENSDYLNGKNSI